MQLIPVIDLLDGVVVHAKQGRRQHYQALQSPLCPSSDVNDVINALLTVFPFTNFYLADLNAIVGRGSHNDLINALLHTHSSLNFWIDAGFQSRPQPFNKANNYQLVLGSECYQNEQLPILAAFENNFILSLDFSSKGEPLGASRLFAEPALWPKQVIIMTLAQVGSNLGPDWKTLAQYQALKTDCEIIAAGGVRNRDDLQKLKQLGIKQALCASALHNKRFSPAELASFR